MMNMPTETEEVSTKSENVAYSFSSYEETRRTLNNQSLHDPSKYIQKVRGTRASPPKPAYDPLQFVQLKPCSLVKSAQEQLKKAETVKKCKEDKKEEPEEWQCNLDNWKSSRRKRVEHIIDRVVEVKKIELEEQDRNRRKSKTFNEMLEERGSRRLKPLPIYNDDDNDDLSELGLGISESTEVIASEIGNSNEEPSEPASAASNIDLSEYTYEGAIEVYKNRISRASAHVDANVDHWMKCETIPNTTLDLTKNSEDVSYNEEKNHNNDSESKEIDVIKIDFLKRKQLFEAENACPTSELETRRLSSDTISTTISVKERLSVLQKQEQNPAESESFQRKPPQVSFTDLKNRLEIFERDVKNATTDKNVCLESSSKVSKQEEINNVDNTVVSNKQPMTDLEDNDNVDSDHEDSGIHTTDVSCSVSQADEQNEEIEQHTSGDAHIKVGIVDNYRRTEPPVSSDNEETNDTNIS